MISKNDLFDYKNRFIYQDSESFKFSIDSILLSEFVTNVKKTDVILDMCAGNMACGLILSTYYQNKIYGFEIQKEIYNLGKKSIIENNLENNLSIINDDVNNLKNYFNSEFFDIIIANPPYFKLNDLKVTNNKISKQIARHEIYLNLEQIFSLSRTFLKNNGSLYIVHRSNRIDDIINFACKYNINVKEIQFISTKSNEAPYLVLVKCIKNSKSGVKINKEICIENIKTYQNIFRKG